MPFYFLLSVFDLNKVNPSIIHSLQSSMRLWDLKQNSAAALINNLTVTEKYEDWSAKIQKYNSFQTNVWDFVVIKCLSVGGAGFTWMLVGLFWTLVCFPHVYRQMALLLIFRSLPAHMPAARHVTPLSGDSMADMHVESRNKSRCSSS